MQTNNYKICLTGSQGTGKTTILNHYRELGYNCITEVVRNLSKQGVPINTMGTLDGQKRIYEEYQRLFKETDNYISDRGLSDVLAYTIYLADTNDNEELWKIAFQQMQLLKEFVKSNPNVQFFYFPIEFPVVNDGVRSMDEKYRKRIDVIINALLKFCQIPFITVTGTVEERIKIIDDAMKS